MDKLLLWCVTVGIDKTNRDDRPLRKGMEIARDFCTRVELVQRKFCVAPAISTTIFENEAKMVYTSTVVLEVFTAVTKLYTRRVTVTSPCCTSTIALTTIFLLPTSAFSAKGPT